MKILIINPGATSTKIAVYEDERPLWQSGAHHAPAELSRFHNSIEQYDYRMRFIRGRLAADGIPVSFDAVIGRGGLLRPLPGGIYRVNELMKHDLRHAAMDHVCNLGGLLAAELAEECGCPA
ncbi:MAG: butyrate kinase, partial [Prevotella sp.]|nr:butyrate kinase [Prevotella sp.]